MTRYETIARALHAAGFRPFPSRSKRSTQYLPLGTPSAAPADPAALARLSPREGVQAAIGERLLSIHHGAGTIFWLSRGQGSLRIGETLGDSIPVEALTDRAVLAYGKIAPEAA